MKRRIGRRGASRAGLVAFALCCGLSCARAWDETLKPEHDALFRQMLKDPANPEISLKYADVATRRGDYEAAIGALERVIFNDPDRAAVRFDLGVLYFRLGSYALAQTYFDSALATPGSDAEMARRSAWFLDEIERRTPATIWSFAGQAGVRHQTNANAGPAAGIVRASGTDIALGSEFARKPDWNWFIGGTLRHVHDLETPRGDVIEAQVSGYHARQFQLTRLDASVVDASLGPRLALAPDLLPGWSVKPYVAATAIALGGAPYLASPGVGVSVMMPVDGVLIEPGYETRWRRYLNSVGSPTASDQSGRHHLAFVNLSGRLSADVRWMARLAWGRANTRSDMQAHTARFLDVGLAYEFDAPLSLGERWTLMPFAGLTLTDYDQPNPAIDPKIRRSDREARAGLRLDAPMAPHWGLGAVIQYSKIKSSIPNYRTNNFSVSFGPTIRF